MTDSRRHFITQKEAAAQLNVTSETIRQWMDRGELFYVWVMGRRKLTQELIDHFIESRITTGPLADDDD